MILVATQCFHPDTGGIENLMTGLADHLAGGGLPVRVYADTTHSKEGAEKPYSIQRFGGIRPWRRWRKSRAIAGMLARNRVTGIFADSWKSIEALPGAVNVPVACLAHGMEYPASTTPAKRARIVKALARCQTVIASSRYSAELVRPYLGGADAKLVVINPPADEPAPPPADALAAMQARIAGRAPVLASVARLEARKGLDSVIRALPALRERHPRIVYLAGGAGADRDRLEALAASEGVADAVVFLGRVGEADKAALLSCASVFAMPARRVGNSVEGFGISYIEAAWFGVPALGGRDCGAADAVLDGETGLLCDGASEEDVTQALLRLLDDDDARRRLGENARARARRDFPWAAALPRYLAAINAENAARQA